MTEHSTSSSGDTTVHRRKAGERERDCCKKGEKESRRDGAKSDWERIFPHRRIVDEDTENRGLRGGDEDEHSGIGSRSPGTPSAGVHVSKQVHLRLQYVTFSV